MRVRGKCHCASTGVHGDAGLFSAAQPAAAAALPAAASGGEPQLTLKGAGGARRWGPAHFEAAPAAPSSLAAAARTPAAGLLASGFRQLFACSLTSCDHLGLTSNSARPSTMNAFTVADNKFRLVRGPTGLSSRHSQHPFASSCKMLATASGSSKVQP